LGTEPQGFQKPFHSQIQQRLIFDLIFEIFLIRLLRRSTVSRFRGIKMTMMDNTNIVPKVQPQESQGIPRSLLSTVLLIAISAGLVIAAGRMLQDKLTVVTSREAVVGGEFTDINAPIDGTIAQRTVNAGDSVTREGSVLKLANDRTSELPVQQIQSRINDLQTRLQRAQNQLDRSLALHGTWSQEGAADQPLKVQRGQESVLQAEADFKAKQAELELANLSYTRAVGLRQQGAIPQADLDKATLEKRQLENELASRQANLQRIQTDQQMTQMGIDPNIQRNNYDPRIRLQELATDIADQRLEIKTIQQSIVDAHAELMKAESDLRKSQEDMAKAPISGVIWELPVQPGQFVQKGAYLGKVLDCSNRWVDAVVDENHVQQLEAGMPATIELNGGTQPLTGRISFIRSGMGRLQAGQDTTTPIAPNMPRTAQVRVALDANADRGGNGVMCYVGYTGKATFKIN
jgi:multidrug resistance efflux pump